MFLIVRPGKSFPRKRIYWGGILFSFYTCGNLWHCNWFGAIHRESPSLKSFSWPYCLLQWSFSFFGRYGEFWYVNMVETRPWKQRAMTCGKLFQALIVTSKQSLMGLCYLFMRPCFYHFLDQNSPYPPELWTTSKVNIKTQTATVPDKDLTEELSLWTAHRLQFGTKLKLGRNA